MSAQKTRYPLMLRHVVGDSMLPHLRPGSYVLATGILGAIKPGQVVVVYHNGLEKIKRVDKLRGDKIYLLGDNAQASTDSRSFGWLPLTAVRALVIWPRVWISPESKVQ